ncbi:hypothetical protein GCM10023185_29930 [Hymenobacter saemangeumensis]|uniref:Transposase n=1 Tax=Hymenobacter saemangeumensis TaxID=1084522 RepID=A0ABP8ILW9_9BACT
MEAYSDHMKASVIKMLRESSPEELACLQAYFEIRRGPGYDLLLEEMTRRGLRPSTISQPHKPRVGTLTHG